MHLRRRCILQHLVGMMVLKISVRSNLSNVSFKTCVSLLIFCFDDLSMCDWGVQVSYYFVLLSISPLSVHVCLMYGGAPMLGA